MPVSRLLKALLVKVVRNTIGLLGRVLRPSAAVDRDPAPEAPVIELFAPSDIATDPDDSSVTRELLLAAAHDEPPAARASRQARIYLERRRRRLNEELQESR